MISQGLEFERGEEMVTEYLIALNKSRLQTRANYIMYGKNVKVSLKNHS